MFPALALTVALACRQDLPMGVIEPFVWADRTIPITGRGSAQTDTIDLAVTNAMRANGVVGCGVCILRNDQVIYCKGFGYQELPDKRFLPTTATRCGSIAKPMTALCALSLMDEGKLDLDEKVLPLLAANGLKIEPIDDRVQQITVRELMDHTSGLPGGATYTSWRPDNDLISKLKLKRRPTSEDVTKDALSSFKLDSDPGTKYQYANANFVILARVIEAKTKQKFADYLTRTMARFGVGPSSIFVSKDQTAPSDPGRGKLEAAYYQTSRERYRSFLPEDASNGQTFGEAYRGYSTECSDGAGGIAISVEGLGRVLASLKSSKCPLSTKAISEILTPPSHYSSEPKFDPKSSNYYSKGFNVRYSGGIPWLSHGGMTNHCGGAIGHNAGYQFIVLSNWNNAGSPYVDQILDHAVAEAVAKLK